MEKITPVLPDGRFVRTYREDYAATDTGSEYEDRSEEDSEYEDQNEVDSEDEVDFVEEDRRSIAIRLQQNQEFLDNQITPPSGECSSLLLESQTEVVLIRKPMASHLSHRLLNPFIYRNIQDVGTLDELAALLKTPRDWEVKYNQVVQDGYIIRLLNHFITLPEHTSEATIQIRFLGLVAVIAILLGLDFLPDTETKVIVGGILARDQYDIRCKTGLRFMNVNGMNLIASVIQNHRSFAPGEMWYHDTRGIQILSALYSFNCPTILFTHKQWKLFVENSERNALLTFPYDDGANDTPHANSSLVQPMGKTFLKAIVICLLSKRDSFVEATNDTSEKLLKRSQKSSSRKYENKQPSFVSGYVAGNPIYSTVRVLSQEDVSRNEDEITLKEKSELDQQAGGV